MRDDNAMTDQALVDEQMRLPRDVAHHCNTDAEWWDRVSQFELLTDERALTAMLHNRDALNRVIAAVLHIRGDRLPPQPVAPRHLVNPRQRRRWFGKR